jgi:hypothetical protein
MLEAELGLFLRMGCFERALFLSQRGSTYLKARQLASHCSTRPSQRATGYQSTPDHLVIGSGST